MLVCVGLLSCLLIDLCFAGSLYILPLIVQRNQTTFIKKVTYTHLKSICYNLVNPPEGEFVYSGVYRGSSHLLSDTDVGVNVKQRLLPLIGFIARYVPMSLPCLLSEEERERLGLPLVIPASDLGLMKTYLETIRLR